MQDADSIFTCELHSLSEVNTMIVGPVKYMYVTNACETGLPTRHIIMHQVLYIVQRYPMKRVTCTLYSIMVCLVIPILSLLLIIQSLYSLSKLQILLELVNIRVKETIILPRSKTYSSSLFEQNLFNFIIPLHVLRPVPVPIYVYVRVHSWLGLMASELKNPTREKTYFHATNSSAPVLY